MKVIKQIPTPYAVSAIAFSPDKKRIAAANGLLPEVLVFDTDTGKHLSTLKMESASGYENLLLWHGDAIISAGNAGTAVYVWDSRDYHLRHHHNVWPYSIKNLHSGPNPDLLLIVLKKPLSSIMDKLGLTEVINVCLFNLTSGQVAQELSEKQELLSGGLLDTNNHIALFGNSREHQEAWWLTATLIHDQQRQSVSIAPDPAQEVLWAYNIQTQQHGLVAVWENRREFLICDQQLKSRQLNCEGDPYGITAFQDSFAILTRQGSDAYFLELPSHPELGLLLPGEATNAITAAGHQVAVGVDNKILIIG